MRPISKRSARFLAEFDLIVVTGGSSGIGRAFLGRVDESATKAVVCNVSRTMPGDWPTGERRVHLSTDLSKPPEIERVADALRKLMPRTGRMLLLNTSGFGAYGEFPAPGLDHTLGMIDAWWAELSERYQLQVQQWDRMLSLYRCMQEQIQETTPSTLNMTRVANDQYRRIMALQREMAEA